MKTTEYQRMSQMEDNYWWHVGRKSILSHQLKTLSKGQGRPSVLNVGCGTGGLIPLIEQYGDSTNIDMSDEALAICRKKGFKRLSKVLGTKLPYKDNQFDIVMATDVLEHIEDDDSALKEWSRVIKPGGHLILTVPAYQWLWSEHDESLHHFRRYTASLVHKKLNVAGLHVTKKSYMIVFSFPLIVGYRLVSTILPRSDKKKAASYIILPTPINRLFIIFLQIEARMLKYINFPFGTSVYAVARKPKVG